MTGSATISDAYLKAICIVTLISYTDIFKPCDVLAILLVE